MNKVQKKLDKYIETLGDSYSTEKAMDFLINMFNGDHKEIQKQILKFKPRIKHE